MVALTFQMTRAPALILPAPTNVSAHRRRRP
jgi:hypothetical protein